MIAAIPAAPAAGSITIAGSWYRQLNSNASEMASTATEAAKIVMHASPSSRTAGVIRRRNASSTDPPSAASTLSNSSGPGVYPPWIWYERKNLAIGTSTCGCLGPKAALSGFGCLCGSLMYRVLVVVLTETYWPKVE